MKSIKKNLFIMVALAATLAFVSCSNGSDDGGSSSNNSSNNGSNNNVSDNNNSSNNNVNDNNSNSNNNNANSGNNVSKPSVVATYESEDNYTLTFFADNTFTITFERFGTERTKWAGTYYMSEGNPSKNGSITITITKELNETSGIVQDIPIAKQVSEDEDIDYGVYVWQCNCERWFDRK